MIKIKILFLFLLAAINVSAQTWEIGSPNAADVTATFDNGTLTISGTGAMQDFAENAAPWASYQNSITTAVIKDGVTNIGGYALAYCGSLTSVTIPNSVTSVGYCAFCFCSGLTSVIIPNSVTSIGDAAFFFCSALTSVIIPNSVTSVEIEVFRGCSGLISIEVESANSSYSSENGVLFNKEKTALICFPAGKSGDYTIPISVTDIGYMAFSGCENLTSVTIPNSVTNIEEFAFSNCYGLTSVTISNSVQSIKYMAFSGCTSLASVTIPNSVTSIENGAFSGCTSLTSIDVDDNHTVYVSKNGVLFNKAMTTLICFPAGKSGNYTIPNSVTRIEDWAFSDCNGLISVTIPNSVTDIGYAAFDNCTGLTSITIPNSVTSIGDAFYYCSGLTDVTVSWDTPLSITAYVFSGVNLSNVNLHVPAGTESLYAAAPVWQDFNIIESTVQTWQIGYPNAADVTATLDNGTLTISGTGAMQDFNGDTVPWASYQGSITTAVIKDGVTNIGDRAFTSCFGLTSVTIPNSVTNIGDYAFWGCSSLTSIVIPNSVTNIGNGAFEGCIGLTSVTIPNSVVNIGENAFNACEKLTSVTISGSVKYIGNYAFQQCWDLASIDVADDNTAYASENGVLFDKTKSILIQYPASKADINYTIPESVTSIEEFAFQNSKYLKSVIIPNSVTSIVEYAFYSNNNLSSVTIPNSVKSIGTYAFGYCTSLTSVVIPNSVTSIGNLAFYLCNNLTSVTIGNSVASMGDQAFGSCTGLTDVTVNWETPLSIDANVFDGVNLSNVNLYVPAGTQSLYAAEPVWQDFNIVQSWQIGSPNAADVTATFNNGTLTISGTGAMQDFINGSYGPWTSYQGSITSAVIEDGVTNIGNNAFGNYGGLTSVTIPNSVTNIGDGAFSACGFTSITIPNSVTNIGSNAFWNCNGLTSIIVPNSVTTIGDYAFRYCTGLTDVTVNWAAPLSINSNVFDGVNLSNVNLYVPAGTQSLYAAEPVWQDFNIVQSWQIGSPNAADVTATFNNGTLTISGTGAMQDFNSNTIPWVSYQSSITTAVIKDGVTNIGDGAFSVCSGLTSIIIPNSVTNIGYQAFSGCSGLTSIIIPNNVTNIRDQAFSGCKSLTDVTVNWAAPLSINSSVFDGVNLPSVNLHVPAGTESLYVAAPVWKGFNIVQSWQIGNPNAADVTATLDNGTLTISGTGAMQDFDSSTPIPWASYQSSITTAVIKDGVTNIGSGAFDLCSGLTSVTIPNSVTSIGSGTFYLCNGLTSVTIPNSVTNIGSYAFGACSNLTTIEVESANSSYMSDDGVLFSKDKMILICFPAGKSGAYTIPNSVTNIGDFAFNACYGLTSVTIPNSVTNIGYEAFSACSGLTSVTIPNSVTIIDEAFTGCTGLTDVTVNWAAPLSIDANVFDSVNLSNVNLHVPPGTQSLYAAAPVWQDFNIVESTTQSWQIGNPNAADVTATFDNGTLTISGTGAMQDFDWDAASWVSYRGSITTAVIEDGVTNIGSCAFNACSGLTSVTIPNSVTSIGNAAFYACGGLTSVIIPNSVTSIKANAFNICNGLTSVTIPNSVTYIDNNVFYYCSKLTSIDVESANSSYMSENGVLFSKDKQILIGFPGGKSGDYTIPNSVTNIEDYAFGHCSGLTSITIPNSVTNIGGDAFTYCTGLTDVTVNNWETPLSIDANVFDGVTLSNVNLHVPAGSESAYAATPVWQDFNIVESTTQSWQIGYPNAADVIATLDNGTLTISGTGAMQGYGGNIPWGSYRGSITTIVIKDGVTNIAGNAFNSCTSLTSVTIPNSVTYIDNSAFWGCHSLTTIDVESANSSYMSDDGVLFNKDKTTLIGFPGGKSGDYTIPNSVTNIEDNAFAYCTGLTSVTILNNVTNIGIGAFFSCSSLTSVTIPNSVTNIGTQAFDNCIGLTDATVNWETPLSINSNVFDGVTLSNVNLHVPAGTESLYAAAPVWQDFNIVQTTGQTWQIGSPNAADVIATLDNGTLTISGTGTMRDFNVDTTPWISYRGFITTIVINDGVTNIGVNAFIYCSGLTSVTIPNSVTNIKEYAFYGCSELASVTIPNSVTNIGELVFSYCTGLTSITIPSSVTNIESDAFMNCSSLTTIDVESANSSYVSENGVLFSKDKQTLICFPGGKSGAYTIPNSVTNIAYSALSYCSGLTSVTIPNSVTNIVGNAFIYCTGLTDVTVNWEIPLSIDASVFSNVNLSNVNLHVPTGTKSLYAAASVWQDFNIVEQNIVGQQYTITTSAGANGSISPSGAVTVNQGDSKTFTFTPNPNYLIDDVLVDGVSNAQAIADGSYIFNNVTSDHTISVSFKPVSPNPGCLPNIIVQVWDDVLSVINIPANNGGYTFTGYQWMKNGEDIPGETSGNLYLTNDADKVMSQYTCRVTTSNGQTLESCPLQSTVRSAVSAYPNPTYGTVIIESSALNEGDRIDIYNSTGTFVKQYLATPLQTKIELGNQPKGLYIIKVNGKQMKIILL